MVATPDIIKIHDISHCDCYGIKLPNDSGFYTARQVFDLPPIVMQITEHRAVKKTCSHCGTINAGVFPKIAKAEA